MIAYHVRCDGCGQCICEADGNLREFFSILSAIDEARKQGWSVNLPGCRDLCPDCAAKAGKR